jgi:8-oxo-dGTP pyrophosphatase MutT (NUDIX family)
MKYAAAMIIADNDGMVLVMKRSEAVDNFKLHWAFPAGGVEDGEAPADCAIRECMEEAEIVVAKDSVRLIGSSSYACEKTSVDEVFYYFSRDYSGEIVLNFENTDYKWVNKSEVLTDGYIPVSKFIIDSIPT